MNRRQELEEKTLARRRRHNKGVPGPKGTDRTEKPHFRQRLHCAIYADDMQPDTSDATPYEGARADNLSLPGNVLEDII